MCSTIFKRILIFLLVSTVLASSHIRTSPICKEYSTSRGSSDPEDLKQAWETATPVPERNPDIRRFDREGNVILASHLTMNSPLTFVASKKTKFANRTVQYGFSEPMQYTEDSQYMLDLIEIALVGYVSDQSGQSFCWVPSEIHQQIMDESEDALQWQENLYREDPKYGRTGHQDVFLEMGVNVNNILAKPYLQPLFIRDYIPQCSTVLRNDEMDTDDLTDAETTTPLSMISSSDDLSVGSVGLQLDSPDSILSDMRVLDGLTDAEFEQRFPTIFEANEFKTIAPAKNKKTYKSSETAKTMKHQAVVPTIHAPKPVKAGGKS